MSYYEFEGYKMYYEVYGSGEPLLIIHGSTASSLMIKEEADFYSKYFMVIVVDIIGHGQSQRLDQFPTDFWNENTKLLMNLCEKLDLSKVNVLGTSGGAIIGLNFAINYPEIIKKVIADSFIGEEFSINDAKLIQKERKIAKESGGANFWEYMHGEDWEQVIDADTEMLVKFAEKYGNNFYSNLNKTKCPVMITGSFNDNLIENIGDKLCTVAKKIKNSTTIFSSTGDHPLMLSNKKFFRKIVLNFLI